MNSLRVMAIVALVWSPTSKAESFDLLVFECRIALSAEFQVDAREGIDSKVSFRYLPEDEFKLTIISVSLENEWRSDNPLQRAPYDVLSQQDIGRLQHLVVRPDLEGFDAGVFDLITDGSTFVKIMGDDRAELVEQFLECPQI